MGLSEHGSTVEHVQRSRMQTRQHLQSGLVKLGAQVDPGLAQSNLADHDRAEGGKRP